MTESTIAPGAVWDLPAVNAAEALAEELFRWNTPDDPYFVINGRAGDTSEEDPYLPIARGVLAAIAAGSVPGVVIGTTDVPPGPCWHDPGVTWSGGFAPRCELLAGHAGAHQWDRGTKGGTAVWTDGEGVRTPSSTDVVVPVESGGLREAVEALADELDAEHGDHSERLSDFEDGYSEAMRDACQKTRAVLAAHSTEGEAGNLGQSPEPPQVAVRGPGVATTPADTSDADQIDEWAVDHSEAVGRSWRSGWLKCDDREQAERIAVESLDGKVMHRTVTPWRPADPVEALRDRLTAHEEDVSDG